ncbi:hypothetical protein RFI_25560, partial [Reticulomyxa filosa]
GNVGPFQYADPLKGLFTTLQSQSKLIDLQQQQLNEQSNKYIDRKVPKKRESEPQYRKKEPKKAHQQSGLEQPLFPSLGNNVNTSWDYQQSLTDAMFLFGASKSIGIFGNERQISESKNKTDSTLLFGEPLKSSAVSMEVQATTETTTTKAATCEACGYSKLKYQEFFQLNQVGSQKLSKDDKLEVVIQSSLTGSGFGSCGTASDIALEDALTSVFCADTEAEAEVDTVAIKLVKKESQI